MPRQARLDVPGTLHHVIVRGIEKRRIFVDRWDRDTTVPFTIPAHRKAGLLEPRALTCCAALPRDSALYEVPSRRLTVLHSGFLQTSPHGAPLPSAIAYST
jgi:hypothetical protein